MSATARNLSPAPVASDTPEPRASTARDYVALTRPRILVLVLLTAPPAMVLGGAAWPDPVTLLGVLVGTALVGAGCSALNAWYERDRDAHMARTRDRPLPAGRLTPAQALRFGLLISALGALALFAVGGWPPALVGALALAHYIFVYTVWLKPRTPQAVVIGGASGAIAPVIADAAIDGSIGAWGLVLFAIIFLWQPPHFWAIALSRKEDYAAAGFPMMPAVAGEGATRRQMLAYALVLLPVTLLPWLLGGAEIVYAGVALVGGAAFVAAILRALRACTREADRRVFHVSIVYLSLLFATLLVEQILG
jgi:protoheme IX farnesyltransferase